MNILVLHAHWNNRGDEAAVRAMIDSLRSELPIDMMRIMLMSKHGTQFSYDDAEVLDVYPSSVPYFIDALLTLLTFGRLSLTERGRAFLRSLDDTDVVIHAPGGPSIGDLYGGRLSDLAYLYRLIVSKILKNKPLFFYAPSMGPFSGKLRNFIRKSILKRADAIILREEVSAMYLKEQLALDSFVTADSAFQNDVDDGYLARYENLSEVSERIENRREKVVGITLTDMGWHPVYGKSRKLKERIVSSIRVVIEHLIREGYTPLLIPQLFGLHDDISLLRNIQSSNRNEILLLPLRVDSYGQQVVISKLFCVITMRYHPGIFAAKGNTPFIPICYEHKIEGFMQKIGLEDLMINIEEISADAIIDRFAYLEKNYDQIKDQLRSEVPRLKELSRNTTRIIVGKIDRRLLEGKKSNPGQSQMT